MSRSKLEKDVAGEYNTFRVYLLMLRIKTASARNVAHQLGFSSPALAVHHLEKLNGLKLVRKDRYGVYHVIPQKFGTLKFFFVVRRFIVPRSSFYAVLYGVIGVLSVFVLPEAIRDTALFFSLLGVVIHLIETVQFYRLLPRTGVQEVEQGVQKND